MKRSRVLMVFASVLLCSPVVYWHYNAQSIKRKETLKKEEVSYLRRHTQKQRVRPVNLTFDLIRNLTTTEAKKSRSELGDEDLKVFPNVHQQSDSTLHVCETMQLLQRACSNLLTDNEYCTTEVKSNLKAYASSISAINSLSVNSSAATSNRWHYEMLRNVIIHCQSDDSIIDQEKLWTNFHEIRTLPIFRSDWENFLKLHVTNLEPDPLLYQRLSLESLTILTKQVTPIKNIDTTTVTVSDLYEEANALRYIGGYVIRTLREGLKGYENALGGLRLITNNDDDTTPAESEEWMCSIDRGGLIRIAEKLCAIEYAVRRSLRVCSTVIPKTLAIEITEDSDVQFNWCMASAEMSDELSHLLLIKMVNKWITIRGFSFTNHKTTRKSKPLRRNLAEKKAHR